MAPDLALLAAAASTAASVRRTGAGLTVESPRGMGVAWTGSALVDGRLWPASGERTVWLPPGRHRIDAAAEKPPLRVLDLNAALLGASVTRGGVEFTYESAARALAVFDGPVERIEIDGLPAAVERTGDVLVLPRGQHFVAAFSPPRNRTASPPRDSPPDLAGK
jgi:hypothetical protein